MSRWLLQTDVATDFRRFVETLGRPSAAQVDQFVAQLAASTSGGGAPRNLRLAGDVAEIRVEGLLTPKLDLFAWLFGLGNTAYADIRAALSLAASEPAVKRVELSIDSPGGTVAGLFETLAALESFKKPITARASLAASAAYAIASKANKIEAVTAASQFGSIGVVAGFFVDEALVEITSTNAPNKRPDPTTDEGKAVVRQELDALHDLFVDAIARGRGKTKEYVNAEFGRGSVLVASEALRVGMIDKAPTPGTRARASAATPESTTTMTTMTIETLKTAHPDLYNEVFKAGRAAERDRVLAHIKAGEQAKCMDTAIKAVKDGTEMTQEMMTTYMMVAVNRRDQRLRQEDSDAAGYALDGVSHSEEAKDNGDRVADAMGLPPPRAETLRQQRGMPYNRPYNGAE